VNAIRIVLVDTTHPGNIGAVARAMKNMALDELALVRPQTFPSAEATARASGADDLLVHARVVASVDEAIADCGFVIGSTARDRVQHWQVLEPRAAAARIVVERATLPVAVLFGAERIGLTNEDLARCHCLLRIPASSEYPSLNLAMAVQIVCYEIFLASGAALPLGERSTPLASTTEMQRFYAHLDEVMQEVDFTDRTQAGVHLMGRLRRLFNRAELDENEVNILRGLLTAIQGKRRTAGRRSTGNA
jgi:tRNA (cytidine32/uridine32-2'-O)-methyltransferase